MEHTKDEYFTTDLHFATALLTNGIDVTDVRINVSQGKTSGVFVFNKVNQDFDVLLKKYYDGELKGDLYAYRNNLKRLKTWAMSTMAQKGAYK